MEAWRCWPHLAILKEILHENGAYTQECRAEGWRGKHGVGGKGWIEREREWMTLLEPLDGAIPDSLYTTTPR